jgi:hypothetical protein
MFHKIRFVLFKKRIKKNPYIGKEDVDGTYLYEQGIYSIRYRIEKQPEGKESVEWICEKRRLSAYEEKIRRIKQGFFDLWRYQHWLVFFRPPILFLLLTSILLFYFGFIETQEAKVQRFKWIVASVAGVNPEQIEYIGDGWLEISTQRKTVVDRINEPIMYRFNPFRWLFSSEAGFISRWRGEPYGSVTHPMVYNERGDVWINKEGIWQQGKIVGKEIEWNTAQGTGIRAGKVTGHELSTKEDKLRIEDK